MFCGLRSSLAEEWWGFGSDLKARVKILITGSHLLDIVTGANIHDDVVQVAELPRDV